MKHSPGRSRSYWERRACGVAGATAPGALGDGATGWLTWMISERGAIVVGEADLGALEAG